MRRPLTLLLLAYGAFLARRHERPAYAYERRDVSLEVVAAGPLREDLRGWKAEAVLPGGERALVRSRAETFPLPGEAARVEGVLRRPRPARNPGDFDEAGFLAERGVSWVLEARTVERVERPVRPAARPAWFAERLHRAVRRRLRARLAPDEARVMEGLLLGYKGALPTRDARALQDSGLIHLVVPSGAKVALVLAAGAWLAALLRLPPWGKLALLSAAGAALVLAAGSEPPYWRAYLAAVVAGAARAWGRESDMLQAVVVSAWALLLLDPRALFTAGFQLTYAAMAGLLLFRPKTVLGVSLAVQAALWPLFACWFGRGALVGAAANLVAVPAAPAAAALGALCCAGGPAWPAALASRALLALARAAAALPFAAVDLSPWPWTSCAAYALALAAVARAPRRSAGLLLAGAVALRAVPALAAPPPLRAVFLKVPRLKKGPRRAALVTFRGRLTWLVGEAPAGLVAKAARGGVDGRIPGGRGLRLCEGAVCLRFDPPGVEGFPEAVYQSAIIAAQLRSSAVEVVVDGASAHVRNPR